MTTAGAAVVADREERLTWLRVGELGDSYSPRSGGENDAHVRLLAASETPFPPILVHRQTMRVIDGMHRLQAVLRRGEAVIAAEFFDGSQEEAYVAAIRANVMHGLPLSLADRKAAAARIVRYRPQWSDRSIAVAAGLSHKTVGVIRRQLSAEVGQPDARLGRDGYLRPVDSSRRRKVAGELLAGRPDASLRDIARAAGISPETARRVRMRIDQGKDHMTGPAADVSNQDVPAGTLEHLRGDPALRFSETGRALLRLLSAQAISSREWSVLVDGVPPHCRQLVIDAANECAKAWLRFADQLN